MVMKEIPREESAEEKPLLTMTSQVGGARGSEEAADTARDAKAPHETRHAQPEGNLTHYLASPGRSLRHSGAG